LLFTDFLRAKEGAVARSLRKAQVVPSAASSLVEKSVLYKILIGPLPNRCICIQKVTYSLRKQPGGTVIQVPWIHEG
jgi:hypothetical protein